MLTGERFTGGLDHRACPFGEWYYVYQADDPAFAELLRVWERPHTQLHASAAKIVAKMDQNDLGGARTVYQTESLPAMEELASVYENTKTWIET